MKQESEMEMEASHVPFVSALKHVPKTLILQKAVSLGKTAEHSSLKKARIPRTKNMTRINSNIQL
jgi:hypothetical protein